MTWNTSKKDTNGWAYESEIGQNFMKAMSSLAIELHKRGVHTKVYEDFFNETTDKIKNLLNAPR